MYLLINKKDQTIIFAEDNKELVCLYLKSECKKPIEELRDELANIDIGETLFIPRTKDNEYIAVNRIPSMGEAGLIKIKVDNL